MGNGNEASGDGYSYRGRGLIQLTGKDNYTACGKALGIDLVADPGQVAHDPVAVLSAGWFWDTRKLNQWADKGDVLTVTKKINGGTIGLEDRKSHYEHILEVLKSVFEEEGK
jgi:putative chitinase